MTDCTVRAGSDPCYGEQDHDGDHWTYWRKPGQVPVVMRWRGDEDWSHEDVRNAKEQDA